MDTQYPVTRPIFTEAVITTAIYEVHHLDSAWALLHGFCELNFAHSVNGPQGML